MTQVHSDAAANTIVNPIGYDSVSVVEAVVSGPGTANRLFTVTGVALFDTLVGTAPGFTGYDVVFLVPAAGETIPVEQGGKGFVAGTYQGGSVTVLPATFAGASNLGWGVDRASCSAVGDLVEVRATAVERGSGTVTYRLSFSLTVLATL